MRPGLIVVILFMHMAIALRNSHACAQRRHQVAFLRQAAPSYVSGLVSVTTMWLKWMAAHASDAMMVVELRNA